jgi:hypothetical protein
VLARIGVNNALEETGKCASKLHGFRGRKAKGLLVQIGVAVVNNSAGRLEQCAGGLFAYEGVPEDHSLALSDHARHFFGKKIGELKGGFVGTALDGLVFALERPGRSAELALYADVAHVLEEAGCLMGERANVLREVCWGS